MDVSLALKNPGQPYPFEMEASVEPMVVLDDPVKFSSVLVRGTYTGAGESVRIEGEVSAEVESRCDLCLKPVHLKIQAPVSVSFVKEAPEFDPEVYPLSGFQADLQAMTEEALLLELPMRFLCSETCKGICPICGTDRNIAPCTCQEGGARQSPFSALSELLTKDEEV